LLTFFGVPARSGGGGTGGSGGITGGGGPDQVAFTASSSLAQGVGPHVNVLADGKIIGSADVGAASATYSFNTKLARNTAHDIQIQYTNDLSIPGQDRNLDLSSITVDDQVIPATSRYEVYYAQGHGTFPGSGAMYWNGVADFSLPKTLFAGNSIWHKCFKDKDEEDEDHHRHHPCKKHDDTEADVDAVVPGHATYGVVTAVRKGLLTIRTREGKLVTVDSTAATKTFRSAVATAGSAVLVRGDYDGKGMLHARSIQRTQDQPTLWGKDQ
jgi:hypothetical protein